MLEDLKPSTMLATPKGWRPSIEYDETIGEGDATTPGMVGDGDFDDFLREAGYDPNKYEVVGESIRTSKWQRYDGEWLTSFRFHFRLRRDNVDLPLLYSQYKKTKQATTPLGDKALVILWSDLQVGKVDFLGGTEQLQTRCALMRDRIIDTIKREKVGRVVFADLGDTVENFGNAANLQQLRTNDLSLMQQVDVATTEAWLTLQTIARIVPDITYASVGSNHCQWRVSKQAVGKPGVDDWGIFITKQIKRLSETAGYNWKFVIPQPDDESVCLDVLGHKVALVHGHQANRPEAIVTWWRGQQFGSQPSAHADILCHGHFHHLRVQECGAKPEGGSRFIVQAATLDNGSSWFRTTSGESAVPGLVCFTLTEGVDYTGTVYKL